MLNKMFPALLHLSRAFGSTKCNVANSAITSYGELAELFERVASTKQGNLPLDLPREFVRNLVMANSIMESERAEDLERFVQCVNNMIVILKVRGSCPRVPPLKGLRFVRYRNISWRWKRHHSRPCAARLTESLCGIQRSKKDFNDTGLCIAVIWPVFRGYPTWGLHQTLFHVKKRSGNQSGIAHFRPAISEMIMSAMTSALLYGQSSRRKGLVFAMFWKAHHPNARGMPCPE